MEDIPFIWADVPGHVSYLLIAISYYLTNIYWLRVTAVMGLTLDTPISEDDLQSLIADAGLHDARRVNL